MKKIMVGFILTLYPLVALELGKVPTKVILSAEQGSMVDGTAWDSSMLKDKVHIVFYVDPDEKDLNKALTERIKSRKFDNKHFNSVAIINLAATWLPDVILESSLEEKQKKFPRTTYVKDKEKYLVKHWNLTDENWDTLLFDKKGKLIYKKSGQLNSIEAIKVIKLIENNI